MKKSLIKKTISCVLLIIIAMGCITSFADSGNGNWIYESKTYRVRLDSPDTAKPYYHLHYYLKTKHIYCQRLDNLRICDEKNSDRDLVPEWLMEAMMKDKKVQNRIKSYNPVNNEVLSSIIKAGAVTVAGILCVAAFFNVFAGPADDAVAWALFYKACTI